MIVPDDCSRVADLEPPENIDDEKKEEEAPVKKGVSFGRINSPSAIDVLSSVLMFVCVGAISSWFLFMRPTGRSLLIHMIGCSVGLSLFVAISMRLLS